MQYTDGLKIDFRLWPVAPARRIAQAPKLPADLDVGYAVLVDKDCLFDEMRPPSFGAYIPARRGDLRDGGQQLLQRRHT